MTAASFSTDIILIGPVRTGKSTVGKLLARELRQPQVSLDDERRRYYRLTPAGRRVASAEAERLWRLVTVARAHRLLSRA